MKTAYAVVILAPLTAAGCATSNTDDIGGSGGAGASGNAIATSVTVTTSASSSTGLGDACTWKACGGDPVGQWTYASACVEVAKSQGSCPGSYVGFRNYLTGTLELHADGTALVDNTLVQETDIYYPKACWAPNATKCEDFVQGAGLSCANTATDCLCKTSTMQPNGASTDSFTMHDGHVVFSDGTDFTFCADKNHLLLIHDTGERTYLDSIE